MRIHILGICGTFMGGIARLAREAGHIVSGSDANVYPPMSTQLESLGITISALDDPLQFNENPDVVVVGNVMSRGKPATEQLLDSGLPYTSGPQWLAENILRGCHVLAVAGTHGKTTTSSMLTWLLEDAGLQPGFLIGGVPANFDASARLGGGNYFVVEADEYDTAFFDKRSKFVHYRPQTLILNNLEYDHADIFDDLEQIKRQFHHLIRTVPGNGRIIFNAADANLRDVIKSGCWSNTETFALSKSNSDIDAHWYIDDQALRHAGEKCAWYSPMQGDHNALNALAAVAAAHHVGVGSDKAVTSLRKFDGVARRMELRATINGIEIFDDFAHHPTAIAATLKGARQTIANGRLVAVLEPRSNTMKSNVHIAQLSDALVAADQVWLYAPPDLAWNPDVVLASLAHCRIEDSVDVMIKALSTELNAGDRVVIMSNGGFEGFHNRLISELESRQSLV